MRMRPGLQLCRQRRSQIAVRADARADLRGELDERADDKKSSIWAVFAAAALARACCTRACPCERAVPAAPALCRLGSGLAGPTVAIRSFGRNGLCMTERAVPSCGAGRAACFALVGSGWRAARRPLGWLEP